MKVYIVMLEYFFDGSEIVSIHQSKSGAHVKLVSYANDFYGEDNLSDTDLTTTYDEEDGLLISVGDVGSQIFLQTLEVEP